MKTGYVVGFNSRYMPENIMNPLITSLDTSEVEEISLVLTSQSIPFHVKTEPDGFAIFVPSAYFQQALHHIGEYSREYSPVESPINTENYRFAHGVPIGLIMLLVSVHFWRMNLPGDVDIVGMFANTISSVKYGQVYRLTTALFLHVDVRHLIGNCAALWLFGSSLCGRLGNGVASFLILYCGILGNAFSVIIRGSAIRSMGASTSVFAGLGILVGMRIGEKNSKESTIHPLLALAAGVALLGFLGTNERSDLFAHFGGFVIGLLSGVIHRSLVPTKSSAVVQRILGGLSSITVLASWLKLIRI